MADTLILQPDGTKKHRTGITRYAVVDSITSATLRGGERVQQDIQRTGKYLVQVNAAYTRPSDTTAYAAGDVVSNSTSASVPLVFNGVARFEGGTGRIVGARLYDDSAPGTAGDFEMHLYRASPAVANDNSAWAPTDAASLTITAKIAFGTVTVMGAANVAYFVTGLDCHFKCGEGLTDLYGVLVARNAYTPASAGVITIELDVEQF
jgi:hypothetical protein